MVSSARAAPSTARATAAVRQTRVARCIKLIPLTPNPSPQGEGSPKAPLPPRGEGRSCSWSLLLLRRLVLLAEQRLGGQQVGEPLLRDVATELVPGALQADDLQCRLPDRLVAVLLGRPGQAELEVAEHHVIIALQIVFLDRPALDGVPGQV